MINVVTLVVCVKGKTETERVGGGATMSRSSRMAPKPNWYCRYHLGIRGIHRSGKCRFHLKVKDIHSLAKSEGL